MISPRGSLSAAYLLERKVKSLILKDPLAYTITNQGLEAQGVFFWQTA